MPTPITLKVFRGSELVRSEQFNREIIKIGRLASAHLCLEDDKISRIHSIIEVAPDGAISIIDMGSAEGTFVNGKKVSRGALRTGDQITLGGLRIELAPDANAAVNEAAPATNRAVEAPSVAAHDPAPAGAPAKANGHPKKNGTTAHAAVTAPAPAAAGSAAAAVATAPAPAPASPAATAAAPAAAPAPTVARAAASKGRAALRPASAEVEDLSGETDLGVELRVLWGETLLEAGTFVKPAAPVLLGESPRCTMRIEGLPVADFPVLRFDDGEYRFTFQRGMTGVVQEKGGKHTFGELVRAKKAAQDEKLEGAYWIPVPRAGAVRAELGAKLAVEARQKKPERVKNPPFWERINYQFLNLFLVLFFVQAGFMVAANNWPYDTDVVADDLFKNPSRMAKFIIKPPEPQKKLELPTGSKKGDSGEMAEKHKGDEGQMGQKDKPKTNARSAPKAIDPNAKDIVKRTGLLGVLGRGGSAGLSTVFGSGGLGGDLKGAVGNMFGPVVGDSYGLGGLGIRGSGRGGGGQGETIGIGAVGTKGRGGGLGGYGDGVGNLGRKGDRDVNVSTGTAVVMGSIDKELIRRVIQEHAAQIRYCYEQQLVINPKLQGKVSIKWIINAEGQASSAQVEGSATTLDDPKVHACMMSKITSWQFPKPKGGGIAVITYPWILRSSGAM
jgi:hypothetical protein